jgi:chromosomal replication initiator protein
MATSARKAWSGALDHLRDRLPERTFHNWVVHIEPDRLTGEAPEETVQLVLKVPHPFHKDYIRSKLGGRIEDAVAEATGSPTEVVFEVDRSLDTASSGGSSGDDHTPDLFREAGDASAGSSDGGSPSGSPSQGRSSQGRSSQGRSSQGRSSQGRSSQDRPSQDRPPQEAPSGERAPASGRPSSARSRTPSGGSGPSGSARARSRPSGASAANDPSQGGGGADRSSPFHRSRVRQMLRDEYTFEQFVAGDSNRLARGASTAVAKDPGGTSYNPLLLYGGVGLGKTHLAQAIAHRAIDHASVQHLCYVSGDQFTSEFVRAIQNNEVNRFSEKYRAVDLLIVDDVQFFSGKEKTQEEFFHLFNDLHQHGKQIVLCADRPPREIDGIEERLLSRFQWGLSADIQRPDLEMRLAILQLKAETLDLEVDTAVLEFMAEHITTNIRELEGALKQLSARAQLTDSAINVETARRLLRDQLSLDTGPVRPQPEDIMNAVAEHYGLAMDDLVERSRRQELVHARQVAMYFCRKMTELSYSAIGLRFAGRDHSTVLYACNKIKDRLESDADFESRLEQVEQSIRRYARES